MMTEFQVKCRRCRHWLMSEESIVDCHGNSVQGGLAGWDCGSGQEQVTRTHLFVSHDFTPPFIVACLEEACYTQGKITCPKCQGRLGSFDFVKNNRKCSCRRTLLPPIHILHNRIDLLPSPNPSPHTSAFQVTSGVLRVKEVGSGEGMQEECRGVQKDPACLADSEDKLSTETTTGETVTAENTETEDNMATDSNRAVEKNTGSEEDETMGLCWLFGEETAEQSIKETQSGKPPLNLHSVEQFSDTISPNPFSLLSEIPQNTELLVCSAQGRVRSGGAPGQLRGSSLRAAKRERREKTRKRNRDRDVRDDLENAVSSDMIGYPSHVSAAKLKRCRMYQQREMERRERMLEKERQVQDEEVLHDHTCPMCLDVMCNPQTTLPCRHNFCGGCLRQLTTITSPSKSDCPMCRRRIHKCIANQEMHKIIKDKYPLRLRMRYREQKRNWKRIRNIPLPGTTFQQRVLSHIPQRRFGLNHICQTLVFMVLLIMALSYVGLSLCKQVLRKLAQVYDDLTERLTGERLWSHFMGVESRVLTVSCVFVLYLLVAFVVQYLQVFQHIRN